jgi:CelD/BcsL family acetyltransferase involved in cellulose biosynthesis
MLHVRVIEDPAALAAHVAAWEELAANAAEPNPFYEPWMVLPALEHLAEGGVQFALVYVDQKLCGLFPLERQQRYRGLPVRHVRLWRYIHCYLGTPLVRRGHATAALRGLLDWLGGTGRASAIEWREVAADGPFFAALTEVRAHSGAFAFRTHQRERAMLRRASSADEYLQRALPGASRKELRRLQARLAERGALEFRTLESAADAPRWIEDFLELEAAGWKGQRGSALASSVGGRAFFRRAFLEAASRRRLMMLALTVSGRPVAMKCNLIAGEGSFAFKIAFDESYARYSPGTLLELENIRACHARPGLQWMDSCAAPEHFMANRLWPERRPLVDLMAATGRTSGNLVVPSLSLLHRLRRGLRGRAPLPAAA